MIELDARYNWHEKPIKRGVLQILTAVITPVFLSFVGTFIFMRLAYGQNIFAISWLYNEFNVRHIRRICCGHYLQTNRSFIFFRGEAQTEAYSLQSGIFWINTIFELDLMAPFGGYKESGVGKELGPDSIESYTQSKTIVLLY